MLKQTVIACLFTGLLAGCEADPLPVLDKLPVAVKRAYAEKVQDHPFDSGPVTVLSERNGELQSHVLRACGDGHVCGHRRGHVTRTADHWVVTGAYPGQTFYLSAGGDGWMKRGGRQYPLAWN